MLESILVTIIVVGIFVFSTYLVRTKDRRMNYMEEERRKHDRDYYKWW